MPRACSWRRRWDCGKGVRIAVIDTPPNLLPGEAREERAQIDHDREPACRHRESDDAASYSVSPPLGDGEDMKVIAA